jgi:nucleoside-diphosphate-sugar epimerase
LAHSFEDEQFQRVNCDASLRLVADLAARFPRLRFLYVSSLAAAGPSREPQSERQAPRPVSAYGRSKLEAEQQIAERLPAGWELAIVRPSMVIGPRDPALLDLVKMVRSRLISVPGIGGSYKVYSFVGVSDLIPLLQACLLEPLPQSPALYFSAHPRPVMFREIIAAIKQRLDIRATMRLPVPALILPVVARSIKLIHRMGWQAPILTPDKVRELRQWGWVCSPQQSIDQLGVTYDCSLETAVGGAIDDYRQRGWI